MLESASVRKDKRIVEHIIGGFKSAKEAITFGNTVENLINEHIGVSKFRQAIAAPDSSIAITEEWQDATVLKTMFLELDQNKANFVCESIKKIVASHEEVHRTLLLIQNEVVREKPQPQTLEFRGKPS